MHKQPFLCDPSQDITRINSKNVYSSNFNSALCDCKPMWKNMKLRTIIIVLNQKYIQNNIRLQFQDLHPSFILLITYNEQYIYIYIYINLKHYKKNMKLHIVTHKKFLTVTYTHTHPHTHTHTNTHTHTTITIFPALFEQ
jgi:hypothetical protein